MPTTTNYGWTTPADTDLVKDGASAIRTLGSSVDTTVKNLNPETTLGDIAYRSSTANVKTRLALGTAGQVLTVNSGATAPEWTTISTSPTFVGVSCTGTGTQTINNSSWTMVTFDTEEYDTNGFHSTSTNTSRITIPSGKGGYYLLTSHIYVDNSGGAGRRGSQFFKNGNYTNISFVEVAPTSGTYNGIVNTWIVNLAVGDYVEVGIWQTSGGSVSVDRPTCNFQAQFLGA